ncbi:unnamed protein product [Amoebophrya sp. A25]|nr:unnamed protein product [Amoebophrya sp. A25]|eukprot:GSA25T00014200001.1
MANSLMKCAVNFSAQSRGSKKPIPKRVELANRRKFCRGLERTAKHFREDEEATLRVELDLARSAARSIACKRGGRGDFLDLNSCATMWAEFFAWKTHVADPWCDAILVDDVVKKRQKSQLFRVQCNLVHRTRSLDQRSHRELVARQKEAAAATRNVLDEVRPLRLDGLEGTWSDSDDLCMAVGDDETLRTAEDEDQPYSSEVEHQVLTLMHAQGASPLTYLLGMDIFFYGKNSPSSMQTRGDQNHLWDDIGRD